MHAGVSFRTWAGIGPWPLRHLRVQHANKVTQHMFISFIARRAAREVMHRPRSGTRQGPQTGSQTAGLGLFMAICLFGSGAIAQSIGESEAPAPTSGIACTQPMPQVGLAPGVSLDQAGQTELCGCIWSKLSPNERTFSERLKNGEVPDTEAVAVGNYLNSFGSVVSGCMGGN